MSETLYQLTVRKGPKVGETFLLETISLTAGRDPVSDIILNDPEVSRQHARFSQTDSGYQVQDLGSTNGTFVNGQRLESEPVDLEPGYTVSMGSGVTLVYEVVPTGNALDATIVDQSGMGEMAQPSHNMTDAVEEWEAAVPDLPHFAEEPEVPADWEPDPSPPFTPPPPSPRPAASQLVATPEKDEANRQKRRNTIIIVVLILLVLCCCTFIWSAWNIWGDTVYCTITTDDSFGRCWELWKP